LGTRREIKNLNSLPASCSRRSTSRCSWQIEQIEDGRAIQQATVLFNPDTGETRADAHARKTRHDYRYFPDPDLPPLVIAPRVGGARARARWPNCRA
jgi:aspartyl-tRNA(Asn)/glutamyl-tRNA(Gln) amidotransferase subunit B